MPGEPLYDVVLLNDDETPMGFVVDVQQHFIGLDDEGACQLMLRVHHEGRAACGTYEREGAEATVAGIPAFAGEHNHPLTCVVEQAL